MLVSVDTEVISVPVYKPNPHLSPLVHQNGHKNQEMEAAHISEWHKQPVIFTRLQEGDYKGQRTRRLRSKQWKLTDIQYTEFVQVILYNLTD